MAKPPAPAPATPPKPTPQVQSEAPTIIRLNPTLVVLPVTVKDSSGALVPDLLDVLVEEDVWVAKEKGRPPRSREALARLIDASVLKEALAGPTR